MSDLNTIDEMIEILQGYREGKTVQVYMGGGQWNNIGGPIFSFDRDKYRLKPEMRAIEIDNGECVHIMKKGLGTSLIIEGPAKFVEVLDD